MTKMILTIGREVFGKKEAYEAFQNALARYFSEEDVPPVAIPEGGWEKEIVESHER